MKSFISLEEAVDILDKNVNCLGIEQVVLLDGIGRTLGENIYSKINNPPFNKSAMDGYAIIAEDTKNCTCILKVIDEIYAGMESEKTVERNTAIRIMTGAPIPIGANAVIKKEEVSLNEETIKINREVKVNENVCFKGEDINEGQLLIEKGKKLDYADIGILASSGISEVNVYKKPIVGFISTGDEILDIDKPLQNGKIYNSNKYSILGRIKELGYEVAYIDHEDDDYKMIGEKIKLATKVCDLILTTGGASVGDKDLMKEAISNIDGEKLFWKVLMKPGSSVLCSKYNEKLIVSLSGNPTAALTSFELLAKTSLDKLSGKEKIEITRERAILDNDFTKKSKQRRFLRGRVISDINGERVEVTQTKSGNGILSSTLNSNCLIELEPGNEGVKKGEVVTIIKF